MNNLQHLLNKVNKVTAYHRHGNKIPKTALDELTNAQIEYEKSSQLEPLVVPKIAEILKGIDKTETEEEGGWWETSVGAKFGKGKLKQINDLLSNFSV